jgi:ATP-binding cassette subfamily B protein
MERFWAYLRPRRRAILTGLLLVPFLTLARLAQPWLLKIGIDDHILSPGSTGLWVVASALLGVVVLAYLLSAFQTWLLQVAAIEAIGELRTAIYRHVMRQGASFFDTHASGSLLTRTTTDVEALGETLTMGVIGMIADALTIVGILAAMLWMDWQLTLITFAISPAIIVTVNLFRKGLRHFSMQIRRSLSRLNGYLAEHLVGMEVIRILGRTPKSRQEFKSLNFVYLDAYRKSNWLDASLYAIMDGVSILCVAAMLWFGGSRVLGGPAEGITLGLLIAFVEYITRIFVPIREFSGRIATLQRAIAAMERIFHLMDTHQVITPGTPSTSPHPDAPITFEDVSFRYWNEGAPVLDEVSFELAPGKVVALVGRTGSGKTTIGKLLIRMYDGYSGRIRWGDRELSELPPEKVRASVSMVHQDVHLFRGTLWSNIAMGNPAITREKAEESLALVRADELLRSLPGGLDAPIAERGMNLSAGEGQLIAFARAVAHEAPVLILDEATSSIDSLWEARIQDALQRLLAMKTVLVVAHRLSTVQQADEILVIDHGKVIERGDHAALLAADGAYARLCLTHLTDSAIPAVR